VDRERASLQEPELHYLSERVIPHDFAQRMWIMLLFLVVALSINIYQVMNVIYLWLFLVTPFTSLLMYLVWYFWRVSRCLSYAERPSVHDMTFIHSVMTQEPQVRDYMTRLAAEDRPLIRWEIVLIKRWIRKKDAVSRGKEIDKGVNTDVVFPEG